MALCSEMAMTDAKKESEARCTAMLSQLISAVKKQTVKMEDLAVHMNEIAVGLKTIVQPHEAPVHALPPPRTAPTATCVSTVDHAVVATTSYAEAAHFPESPTKHSTLGLNPNAGCAKVTVVSLLSRGVTTAIRAQSEPAYIASSNSFATGELDNRMPAGCSMIGSGDDTALQTSAFMPGAAPGSPSTTTLLDVAITSPELAVATIRVRDDTGDLTAHQLLDEMPPLAQVDSTAWLRLSARPTFLFASTGVYLARVAPPYIGVRDMGYLVTDASHGDELACTHVLCPPDDHKVLWPPPMKMDKRQPCDSQSKRPWPPPPFHVEQRKCGGSLIRFKSNIHSASLLLPPWPPPTQGQLIKEVAWVIFDEIHYMEDRERGVVWDGNIIFLPPAIKMVFLSATMSNATKFAEWICNLHKQSNQLDGRNSGGPKATGRIAKGGSASGTSDIYRIAKMIMERKFQPVIIFSLNRREWEHHAMSMSKLDFSTEEEKDGIEQVFCSAIFCLSEEDRSLPAIELLLPLLKRGIAVHHFGLRPIIKEIVELLFQEGLVKVLFATKTFAMGLNNTWCGDGMINGSGYHQNKFSIDIRLSVGLVLVVTITMTCSLVIGTLVTRCSSLVVASLWQWNGEKHTSYRLLAKNIFGPWGYWYVSFFQQVALVGNNITIQIVAGSSLKAANKHYHTAEDGAMMLQHFILLVDAFELFPSQLPDIHSLRWVNATCTASTIGFVGTTIGVTTYDRYRIDRKEVDYSLQGSTATKISRVFNALGTIAFSFGDAMLPEIQSTVREPVRTNMYNGVSVKFSGGSTNFPTQKKAFLMWAETNMLLMSPATDGKPHAKGLHQLDIETEKVVSEWKFEKDGADINMRDITNHSKGAQMDPSESTFFGLDDNRLCRWDRRDRREIVQNLANAMESPVLQLTQGHQFSRGKNFQCFASTGDGSIVVGSLDGKIRLYSKSSMRMAKTAFPGLGSPSTHVDVTYDGRWILGTTDTDLILICTIFINKVVEENERFDIQFKLHGSGLGSNRISRGEECYGPTWLGTSLWAVGPTYSRGIQWTTKGRREQGQRASKNS